MIGSFGPTGVRPASLEIADRLAFRGWSVLRVSARTGRAARLGDMLLGALSQRRAYAKAHLDVFSGNAFIWAEAVAWLLRRLRKPYVLTLRGGNLPAFARRWPGRVRNLLESAAEVTAPSGYLRESLIAYREDIRLIPNGIEIRNYAFAARTAPAPRLLWLRAFHAIYGPELAPMALARLVTEFPDARLTMIGRDCGDGSLARTLKAARSLGVADRITMSGPVDKTEIPARLGNSDIFLNTATVDNTPVTVLEAMAAGLCVVSTRVGGIPWLLEDGVDALLVPPSDPDAMAAAIRRILLDPALAGRLSTGGRARAMQSDWSLVLPQWEQLLASVHGA